MPEALRILVGHEPQFYRETLATALPVLLPNAEVTLVEPAKLDEEIARGGPILVFCSVLTEKVRRQALVWVLLYPGTENLAVIGLAGQQRNIRDIGLNDLLTVIVDAQRLLTTVAAVSRGGRVVMLPDVAGENGFSEMASWCR